MSLAWKPDRSEPLHLRQFPSPVLRTRGTGSANTSMSSTPSPRAARSLDTSADGAQPPRLSSSTRAGPMAPVPETGAVAPPAAHPGAHPHPPPSTVLSVPATATPPGQPAQDGLRHPPLRLSPATHSPLSPVDTAREVYNEKLRSSIDAIMEALAAELPQDHILLQLFADATTVQYCKVRMVEVVELFLYATQAEQFHSLAAELARRAGEALAMRQRMEELERRLAATTTTTTANTPAPRAGRGVGVGNDVGGVTTPAPTSVSLVSGSTAPTPWGHDTHSGLGGGGGGGSDAGTNPMAEEAARRELMAILEATARETELDRCRRALAAPLRLSAVAHREPEYAEKHAYVSDVVAELFAAAHAFLRYADGSLESLDALRNELAGTKGSVGGAASSPGGGVGTAAVGGAPSPATPPCTPARGDSSGLSPTAVERARIQRAGEQLRDAQVLVSRALEHLRATAADQGRELARRTHQLDCIAGREASEATTTATDVRALQRTVDAMTREHARALEDLAEEHRRAHDSLERRLRTAQQQQSDAQRQAVALQAELDAVRGELALQQARGAPPLREDTHAVSASASQAQAQALHQAQAGLRAREGELLRARAAQRLAELDAQLHASEAAKQSLLLGQYTGTSRATAAARALADAGREAREELRHVRAQLQLREADGEARDVAERARVEELSALLRAMWEDESVAAALQLVEEGHRAAALTPSAVGGTAGASHGDAQQCEGEGGGPGHGLPQWRQVQEAHRLPTTLAGLVEAVRAAHRAQRGRMEQWQDALQRARARVVERDDRIRVLEASEARLHALLQGEQEQSATLRAELDRVTDTRPMRELLARQESLLRQVSEERSTLSRRWNSLTADYIALERRNGELHERCAAKEHENAKLAGLLRSSGSASGLARSPASALHTPTQATGRAGAGAATRPVDLGMRGAVVDANARGPRASRATAVDAVGSRSSSSSSSSSSHRDGSSGTARRQTSDSLEDSAGVTPVKAEGWVSDASELRAPRTATTPMSMECHSGPQNDSYEDDFETP